MAPSRDTLASDDWALRIEEVCADPTLAAIAFQPIVDLSRGEVAGYEALARLPGPEGPEPWFAAATRLGKAGRLEAAVIGRILEAQPELPPNTFLSINVSPPALLSEPVRDRLACAPLEGVVLEITEQAQVDDYDSLAAAVAALRARGAMIAIDDVGAGYASLRHVLRLRPDFVKLDRELVKDCDRDEAQLAVLEMMGDFAGRVDAWIVAEGIERDAELAAVMRMAVPLAQGYHLARPGPRPEGVRSELATQIRDAAGRRAEAVGLESLVEATVVLAADAVHGRHPVATGAGAPDHVVLVDERGRPVGLMRDLGAPAVAPMTAVAKEAVTTVARRAMARSALRRFDPIAVCDDLGRVTGIVTVERLVEYLATAV